ncbi:helix-turn-helix domain-containing protein [Neorhizobium galegae]|uniref:helix-turn-helix transcriptional regulator n=1 Tax=Neorhizobium galegae TaxID=399 RepID=UPI002101A233|nr:helix-turn-helix domain-containing protein [Neorhizobium galegae]MCQ1573488.1 helix-turn-helix domain-containing protein [Neorhizobium galegae]
MTTKKNLIITERLLTEIEVAERQQRSIKTLQNQRVIGNGIPFVKIGRLVRYRLSDVVAYEEARTFGSTSDKI